MISLLLYLIGIVTALTYLAYRDPYHARPVFVVVVFWPAVLLVLLIDRFVNRCGWSFDIDSGPGGWGKRDTNDGQPGIALRCPWFEIQFWKKRK